MLRFYAESEEKMRAAVITVAGISSRFNEGIEEDKKCLKAIYTEGNTSDTLLSHLASSGVQVYGKGLHGRHNDDTNGIVSWFVSQYDKILREDFGRVKRD